MGERSLLAVGTSLLLLATACGGSSEPGEVESSISGFSFQDLQAAGQEFCDDTSKTVPGATAYDPAAESVVLWVPRSTPIRDNTPGLYWRSGPNRPSVVACYGYTLGDEAQFCEFDNGVTASYKETTWDVRLLRADNGELLQEATAIDSDIECPFGLVFSTSEGKELTRPIINEGKLIDELGVVLALDVYELCSEAWDAPVTGGSTPEPTTVLADSDLNANSMFGPKTVTLPDEFRHTVGNPARAGICLQPQESADSDTIGTMVRVVLADGTVLAEEFYPDPSAVGSGPPEAPPADWIADQFRSALGHSSS